MSALVPLPRLPSPPDPWAIDQRVVLHDVSWAQYETILQTRGHKSGVRITYLDGELELMSPSRNHELDKKYLGRVLEAWADTLEIEFEGYGSWTVRKRSENGGAEADECYVVGPHDSDQIEQPDLAIEVVWSRDAIDKLEVWRRLGVKEVWIWQDRELRMYKLGAENQLLDRSELLPALDPALIAECMAAPSQSAAVRLLRQRLGEGSFEGQRLNER